MAFKRNASFLDPGSVQSDAVFPALECRRPGGFGFNALTNQFGDMVEMGVLDPCKVTGTALQNAASIAGLILTTDCMIAQRPEPESSNPLAQDLGMR